MAAGGASAVAIWQKNALAAQQGAAARCRSARCAGTRGGTVARALNPRYSEKNR